MSFGNDSPFGGPPGGPEGRPDPQPQRGRKSPLMPTIIVIGILVAIFVFVTSIYADVLWYNQLGFQRVFWTEYLAKAGIFAAAFLLMGFATRLPCVHLSE